MTNYEDLLSQATGIEALEGMHNISASTAYRILLLYVCELHLMCTCFLFNGGGGRCIEDDAD